MSAYNGIYTDLNSLAQLRTRAEHNPATALDEVATQFEALFTRMMLETMRESSLGDSLLDGGQNEQYLEMFDSQVALEMSRGRGLGLKQMLIRQLGGEQQLRSPEAAQPVAADWRPASREEFIATLLPMAREVENELGISHRAVLAHAALESGWGRHLMRRPDGGNAFNLFGIKADASWHGPQTNVPTLEFRDGVAVRETAGFRVYESLDEAMADYVSFIRGNPRYRAAIEHGADAGRYATELAEAGYATDPDYARKLADIASGIET